jgi:metallo-beta-lactamase family protein
MTFWVFFIESGAEPEGDAMKIEFHGAVRTVTGSQHLIHVNGRQILLECGLFQGSRQESYLRNQHLPFDAGKVDAMILSHAHIDHCGNVPNLVKSGFRGDIICTFATRDLCTIMLRDSGKIQEADIAFVNKKRARRNEPPLEPIYTMADAEQSLKQFLSLGYERPHQVIPGVQVTFYDAGHILGSAIVVLDIEDQETGREVRLVFSGDLGRPDRPILNDPALLDEADVLLVESTYGDREHEPTAEIRDKLEDVVNRTAKRGGKIIVPAFAVGRTQELVYALHQLVEARDIPAQLPVYVDSPLAIDATNIYRLHPEAYDERLSEFLNGDKHRDPFGFDMMRYTRSAAESKELNHLREPAIIISASGMAEAGRILHHLKNNIEDARNTVLIVGWQAPNTLGRRLLEELPQVRIFGEEYDLRAEVVSIDGLSAHADRSELLAWTGHFGRKASRAFIVHGEPGPALAIAEGMRHQGYLQVDVPELGQGFSI